MPVAGQHLQVYGCSTNATDSHQAWKELPAGGSGGGIKFQLAADPALCIVPAAPHGSVRCSGTCLVLGPCGEAPAFVGSGQKFVAAGGKQCLDVDLAGGATKSYRIELYACNDKNGGGKNQQFTWDEATGILSPAWFGTMGSCVSVCQHTSR